MTQKTAVTEVPDGQLDQKPAASDRGVSGGGQPGASGDVRKMKAAI